MTTPIKNNFIILKKNEKTLIKIVEKIHAHYKELEELGWTSEDIYRRIQLNRCLENHYEEYWTGRMLIAYMKQELLIKRSLTG